MISCQSEDETLQWQLQTDGSFLKNVPCQKKKPGKNGNGNKTVICEITLCKKKPSVSEKTSKNWKKMLNDY